MPRGAKKGNKHWLGRKHTPETLAKMRESHLDIRHTDATKEKLRELAIQQFADLEKKLKNDLAKVGKKRSLMTRRNMSLAKIGKPLSDKHKESLRLRWQEEERRRIGLEHLLKIQSPTSIENKLFLWLIYVFPTEAIFREYRIGGYRVDFALPNLMLVFEADGNYWHNLPGRKVEDEMKDKCLNEQGWKVERFIEEEINNWRSC